MTDREVFLRCAEMLTGSGIREVRRLLNDTKELYLAAMTYEDEPVPVLPRRTRVKRDEQADDASS